MTADLANSLAYFELAEAWLSLGQFDKALADWCASLPAAEVVAILERERVPVGLIYNIEDQFNDPHFRERGMFEEVLVDGKPLTIPAITPILSETPGRTDWAGAEVGAQPARA